MRTLTSLCLCLFISGCAHQDEVSPKPMVDVKVARAEVADIRISVRASATVFPREQASLAPRIIAPIRELRVRKGDSVSPNQLLALLENRDIIAQRQEAAAALEDATANLQKLSAGTLPTDIERARGQLAASEAVLNQAQKLYDRRNELFKQGAIPARDLLISQTELANARANYEVARRSLDLLENQLREKEIRIAESRVAQARARLALAEAQLQFTELRSPFAGTVTEQFLYPGDMAKPEAPVVTVMDLSFAIARGQVPETDAADVRLRQICVFEPVDSQHTGHEGKVIVVNKAVDPARRTVEVWCEIPNPKRELRAGVFGSLVIYTGAASNTVAVPLSAVQFAEGSRSGVVLAVDDKGFARRKEVLTGSVFEGRVQIKNGLKAGELVIVEGGYGLPDGAGVRFTENAK